ncbi:cell adhesion molecule 4 isoform X1 [Salmo salar]|uniref:Cell adhesion molecule 4 n=1 Tax=Salmo salar TaxID=8030 RepID=A0A1S3N6U3_SALSA|nr:cell adhesion molecule 4-like isoform X1 [Salmo salar]XP_045568974.1 cell adhesion molecule 4-like isoform X1 [Salmo salar]|eukprot:XP_014011213.1 PREDICTED: cell adhesion molecule 4-like isoform X4 [Salmo salar]
MRPGPRSLLLPTPLSLSLRALVLLCLAPRCQAVQAENVTVLEGGTAQISCRLQNYDGSIVVIQNPRRQTLFFNGTRALKDDRFQMVLFTPRLVRITLTNVSVSDEGGYFCQLYTDDTHHQVATLSVSVPPDTPTVEVRQEAVEGGEVELTCLSPRSKPPATLRWIRDRREMPGVVSQQENGKTVSVSSTIRLSVERKDNGAAVSCEASHPALGGQKRVRHYRLDVHFAPTVRIIPPPGILREGDSLSLTCSITGNPLPRDVQWTRINDTLPERAEISGPTLQVSRLSQSHNGTYLCQAQNNYGRAADHYTLLVYENVSVTTMVLPTSHHATSHPITLLITPSYAPDPRDPGAVIETHSAVPYAVIGGVLALLVFTIICVLIITIWCSVRQKGSYLTHEASGLDEHGEVQEAFLNGNDASQGKKEYLL